MYFAQINGAGVCVAVTQSSAPLVGAQFVPLASLDISVLGKKWNGSSWEVVP